MTGDRTCPSEEAERLAGSQAEERRAALEGLAQLEPAAEARPRGGGVAGRVDAREQRLAAWRLAEEPLVAERPQQQEHGAAEEERREHLCVGWQG